MGVKIISRDTGLAFENLVRGISLLKQPDKRPYRGSDIRVALVDPNLLYPAATYVDKNKLRMQQELQMEFADVGVNLYRPDGLLRFVRGTIAELQEPDKLPVWGLMPPVVEVQREGLQFRRPMSRMWEDSDPIPPVIEGMPFRLINDGLHRVWAARKHGFQIQVVMIDHVDPSMPYYCYPASWEQVIETDGPPEDKKDRKKHRIAYHYELYRDFGLLGVGAPRHPVEIRP